MQSSYSPLQIGIKKDLTQKILYSESKPSQDMEDLVYCFWRLRSNKALRDDFLYTVLPDACLDIVFDLTGRSQPLIMTPKMEAVTLTLGKSFSYVGIRFKPGVFNQLLDIKGLIGNQESLRDVVGRYVAIGGNNRFKDLSDTAQLAELNMVVRKLVAAQVVAPNPFIENVLEGLKQGMPVNAIAEKEGMSARQLRRKVLRQTGYSPVQLRRVVRFQTVLSSGDPLLRFADQSHLIKEFKSITGASYNVFTSSFIDVRKVQS